MVSAKLSLPQSRPGYACRRARPLRFLTRWPSRRATLLALVSRSLIIVNVEDHDIRATILGMGRVVAIYRCIRILFQTSTNPRQPLGPSHTTRRKLSLLRSLRQPPSSLHR